MVRAWYMDDDLQSDQRLEHHRNPPVYIDLNTLFELTGVRYFKFDLRSSKMQDELNILKKDRGYSYEDEIVCSKECLPDYENKLKIFYEEHLHTDEEIRFVLEGSGYFDVRDAKDEWIRIQVEACDLIIIPAGIYHRFTLDTRNFIKAKRYFVGEPVWKPYNRPVDEMACRRLYLECLKNKFK
ncbi:acireductone dioxygenase [Chironomus tepperi]|uniref:acireductone dioxygenase n=1 Tax=Chironomus tepperi TaxID=113505 RepID=UPI00391F0D35